MRRRELAALSLGAAAGPIAAAPRWKVLAPERYAPFCWLEAGKPRGVLVERLRVAAQASGLAYKLEITAWARALAMAERGEAGLLGVSRTPEREAWLDFSQPLAHDELMLWVRAGQAFAFNGPQDLRGRAVGKSRRTTGGPAFDALEAQGELRVLHDDSGVQRLLALRAGRLDVALLGNGRTGLRKVVAGHESLREADFEALPRPLLRDALHLAFPKSMQAKLVLARFNEALRVPGPQPASANQPR